MKRLTDKLLPHPLMSVMLWVSWLWLNDSIALGHVVLGALLGWFIPLYTRRFWPERVSLHKPLTVLTFLTVVLFDIVVANLEVAQLIMRPRLRLRAGFARVPLDLRSEYAITVFASTISLTPGTVSVNVSPDRRVLTVHYLSSDNPDDMVATVKRRYESRIKEIFEPC